jgi:fructose-1,6-bisphosphatase/inositol monophosphatase family enzyme
VEDPDPQRLLDVAVHAARVGADLLRAGMLVARTQVTTKTSATDMVTEMDRASEDAILEVVLDERPDDSIVAEEGSTREGTTGVRWVIDPLDGTTNYLYRHPGFAVSIAAAYGGEVVAGAVLDVVHDELFTATRGGGAHCNGSPIACSTKDDLATALISTGFGYDPQRRAWQARQLVSLLPRVRDIRRMGAAAVDLCSVACGRVDAYFERGLAEWDLAAGWLIAGEAGALVSAIEGGPPRAGSLVAAAPGIFEPLRALIREAEAAAGPEV